MRVKLSEIDCLFFVQVAANLFYYSFYAFMLYRTVKSDINYWRSGGSLIHSFTNVDFSHLEKVTSFNPISSLTSKSELIMNSMNISFLINRQIKSKLRISLQMRG
jgi:hypothetical protein